LGHADRSSLNVEGAFQHILTDLFAFIGTAVAGVVILATGYRRADPIASLLVVVLMLRAAWGLLGASGHVLLEGTPHAVDLDEVRRHLLELPEVLSVHALHAWTGLGSPSSSPRTTSCCRPCTGRWREPGPSAGRTSARTERSSSHPSWTGCGGGRTSSRRNAGCAQASTSAAGPRSCLWAPF